jgi:predicted nucleotidyltransferase
VFVVVNAKLETLSEGMPSAQLETDKAMSEVGSMPMLNQYLETIKERVLAELAGEDVAIGLFGSMASGRTHAGSDVDIAVVPKGVWNSRKLTLLREELEELNVPYVVELVDFSGVSRDFREFALEHVLWWKE